ncbi:hypothetical protein TNCV_1437371 [Trichonephila clavipes]|nr:hypothetical protein TNCV_1437371 [Trichonephila clavipes]
MTPDSFKVVQESQRPTRPINIISCSLHQTIVSPTFFIWRDLLHVLQHTRRKRVELRRFDSLGRHPSFDECDVTSVKLHVHLIRHAVDPNITFMEDETDQAIEEPDEIMHINRDSESKYDKSDRHETFELNCNFQMLPKELYQEIKKSRKLRSHKCNTSPCQKDKSKKRLHMLSVDHQRIEKLQ